MITKEAQLAARNAADGLSVTLRFAHVWPTDQKGVTPRAFFHVVDGDYARGSTITLETCFRLGLRVEVIE